MKEKVVSKKIRAITFGQWAETYLQLEEVKSLRSFKDRVATVRYQLVPFFGRKGLVDIKTEDIEDYRDQRKLRNGKEPSLQTVNNDHTMLKHMRSVAERKGLVQTNVAKKYQCQHLHQAPCVSFSLLNPGAILKMCIPS